MLLYAAKLQEFMEMLLARYRAAPEDLHLRLQLGETELLVMSQSSDRRQIKLNRFTLLPRSKPAKELEILFFVDDKGHWIPFEYFHPFTRRQVCGSLDKRRQTLTVDNPYFLRGLLIQCDLWAIRLHNQGWLEQSQFFSSAGMELAGELLWPMPTVDEPDEAQLEAWFMDDLCEATDGCPVAPDGTCSHGHPSWLLRLGLV